MVRLDRGFTDGIVESARLHKITAGMLRIAGDLGLASVADGVDRPEHVLALRGMGCTYGQGMACSGPLEEHRLRSALSRDGYPVPRGEVTLTGGPLPVRGTLKRGELRPNNETVVPPA
jgi:predicted signal transduction protein with EAL and GGDEF domain